MRPARPLRPGRSPGRVDSSTLPATPAMGRRLVPAICPARRARASTRAQCHLPAELHKRDRGRRARLRGGPSGSGTGATSYTSRCAPLEWTIHGSPTACPLMASHTRTVASPLPLASRGRDPADTAVHFGDDPFDHGPTFRRSRPDLARLLRDPHPDRRRRHPTAASSACCRTRGRSDHSGHRLCRSCPPLPPRAVRRRRRGSRQAASIADVTVTRSRSSRS